MKSYGVEVMGTFFLTVAVTLCGGNPIAVVFMLASLIYIAAHVSGAHFNPALSVAAYMNGDLSAKNLLYYTAAQTVGALAGLLLFKFITHIPFSPEIPAETPLSLLFSIETLLTIIPCMVFLAVTTVPQLKHTAIYGIAIACAFGGVASIGGLFNPAIGFGSFFIKLMHMDTEQMGDLVTMHQHIITHTIAPLIGACVATWFHKMINERA